jgi:hypothetical protein
MSWERHGGLREAIAQLAAQIMYGEDVKQYFTAKRLAAKRLLGQHGARSLRYRPTDLPSNGEIKDALLELVEDIEGDDRTRRLFAMRVVALEAMEQLLPFLPRLIGSVATGHVRSGITLFSQIPHADVNARGSRQESDDNHETRHKRGKQQSPRGLAWSLSHHRWQAVRRLRDPPTVNPRVPRALQCPRT